MLGVWGCKLRVLGLLIQGWGVPGVAQSACRHCVTNGDAAGNNVAFLQMLILKALNNVALLHMEIL